jgi:hypothetical protein
MNKYLSTLIFYTASFLIIFLLNTISPNAHDGGLGLGSIAILLLTLVLIVLIGVNIYRGIKKDKGYFIITAIHAAVLLGGVFTFFL